MSKYTLEKVFFLSLHHFQPVQSAASAFAAQLSAILAQNMQCSLVPLHYRSNFFQTKANCSADIWDYIAPCILFLYWLLQFQQKAYTLNHHIPHSLAQRSTQNWMASPQISLHQPAWVQIELRQCHLDSAFKEGKVLSLSGGCKVQ